MLGDLDQSLGKIEDLSLFLALAHGRRERRPTMPARPGRMFDNPVGRGRPAQRIALVARLPAAHFAGTAAKTARHARLLPKPVARGRLGTRRTVLIEPPTKFAVLRPQRFVLRPQRLVLRPQRRDFAMKRFDQQSHVGGENHPHLDSRFVRPRQSISPTRQNPHRPVANETHLGSY
jgi:hypothetical protein